MKYKGLNKNPISCEIYSEVLSKFLIINWRVEGVFNTSFIPTVPSTGCGIDRILCDNDKHLRMSANLQMFDKCDFIEWFPLHIQYILQVLVHCIKKNEILGQLRKSENSDKEIIPVLLIYFLNYVFNFFLYRKLVKNYQPKKKEEEEYQQ